MGVDTRPIPTLSNTPSRTGITTLIGEKIPIETGVVNPRLDWADLVITWTATPVLNKAITGGEVFTYTYGTTDRFRFVPSPYDSTLDGFYSTFDSGTDTLSGLLATRGQAI